MKRRPAAATCCAEVLRQSFRGARGQLSDALRLWKSKPDEKSLHLLRIKLRRFRALISVFENELDGCPHDVVGRGLATIGDHLGALRDLDVMMNLCRKSEESCRDQVIALMEREREDKARRIGRLKCWRTLEVMIDDFTLRLDAYPVGKHADQAFPSFYRKQVRRQVRRILRSEELAKSDDALELHAFRKKLRRLRYLGDLLSGEGGSDYDELIRRAHACEQKLGKVHDIDMALAWLRDRLDEGQRAGLEAQWLRIREQKIKRYRKAWTTARRAMGLVEAP